MNKPPISLYLSEHFRAIKERMQLSTDDFEILAEHRANPTPVLVIPGFMTSDRSTKTLRKFIEDVGLRAYPWTLGVNLGDFDTDMSMLEERLESISKDHGTKVILIGWSLGGIYARELAKLKSELVEQVITLGSPFRDIENPKNNVMWLFNLVSLIKKREDPDEELTRQLVEPAPVKTHAIYSKLDGIVPWEACKEVVEDEDHINVEVASSHVGMGYNKEVYTVLYNILSGANNYSQHSG